MSRFHNTLSLLALLTLLLALSACADNAPKAKAFGSEKLLHGLWFDGQLAGNDHDLVRSTLPEPDLRPPLRTQPLRQQPPVAPERQRVITSVTPSDGRKVVALTFDLCERAPHLAGYQKDIINYLRAHNIKATFFAGGKWMRSHPDKTMQLMADPLFEIGNHGWTHGNLALMDEAEVRQQIDWTQAQYELLYEELDNRAKVAGLEKEMDSVRPDIRIMRLPYGRNNEQTAGILAAMGLPMIQWSIEGERNETEHTVDELVQWDVDNMRPGAIILMHANAVPKKTHFLVPALVPALQKMGYEFVTVSELLDMGQVQAVDEGYFTHPGDNLYVDKLFAGKGTLGRVSK